MPNYVIDVTIEDGERHKSVVEVHLVAADEAAAVTRAAAFQTQLLNFTLGKITRATLTRALTIPAGNPAVPDPDCDVEIKAMFTYDCANGKRTRFSIPAFDRQYIMANSDEVDPSQYTALNTEIIGQGYADSNWSDITAFVSALEAYGRKR